MRAYLQSTRFISFALALTLSLALRSARAQDEKSLTFEQLRFRFEVQRVEIEKPLTELNKKYDAQLAALIEKSQKAGNLDEVLAARAEREILPAGGHHRAANAPEFSRLQQLYKSAIPKLQKKADADLDILLQGYAARLAQLQKDLTVAGKIDDAVKARDELDRIAKLIKNAATSSPTAPTERRPPLPPGVLVFKGHSYKVIPEERTWQNARDRCGAMGGRLACIESSLEMHFIRDFAKRNARWIGGYKESEGVWKWVNGAPFDYTSWQPGQPNNVGGDEDSLGLGKLAVRGKWGDFPGHYTLFFICEWDWTPPAKAE